MDKKDRVEQAARRYARRCPHRRQELVRSRLMMLGTNTQRWRPHLALACGRRDPRSRKLTIVPLALRKGKELPSGGRRPDGQEGRFSQCAARTRSGQVATRFYSRRQELQRVADFYVGNGQAMGPTRIARCCRSRSIGQNTPIAGFSPQRRICNSLPTNLALEAVVSRILAFARPLAFARTIRRRNRLSQSILDMHKSGKLFEKSEFKAVRAASAQLFLTRQADTIKEVWGSDYTAIMAYLEKQKELKEELFSAINPQKDDVTRALAIFRELWKTEPEAVAKYPNLAIAITVVWDQPENVYDYRNHQVRTKSNLPDGYLGL